MSGRGLISGLAVLASVAFLAAGSAGPASSTPRRTPAVAVSPAPPPPPPLPTPTRKPVDCEVEKCVALTFDDGPGPDTGRLLDMFAKSGGHATFFIVGPMAREYPDLVRRAYAEGHEIANHTEHHLQLSVKSPKVVHREIEGTNRTIRELTGVDPVLFRPPYGATDKAVGVETRKLGLAQILWSVDTLDWQDKNADIVSRRAIRGLHRDAIILMHDIHPTTIAAVPRILKACKAKGLTPVPVSDLLGPTKPGRRYFGE